MIEQTAPTLPPPRVELIYDKKEAFDYYQKFIKAEKKLRRRRAHVDALEFFGDASEFIFSFQYYNSYPSIVQFDIVYMSLHSSMHECVHVLTSLNLLFH